MAMFDVTAKRPDIFERFVRDVPQWYRDAKLGIFVHWGAYSVPAWAEPIGPLGAFTWDEWYPHNPYAEWYYNTIRIEGSPARRHQQETYGGAPYDDFLDAWQPTAFDPADLLDLVARTEARYFVPTTKHHDGITLWDAPGTGDRNTVRRGPRRDLVAELREACLAKGLRFGVYYSGGLDWHAAPTPPLTSDLDVDNRAQGQAYADYAFDHVMDLVERFEPALLWGDIEWPDAGKTAGPKGLVEMFDRYYAAVPDGVVNDRFGTTHWDFRTSEYVHGLELEGSDMWERCHGIGYSFAYNRLEDESNSLSGPDTIVEFVDIVSRGGNLLLNVGISADGVVPAHHRRTLEELGEFSRAHGDAIFGSRPLPEAVASPGDEPWIRWTRTGDLAHAFVLSDQDAELPVDRSRVGEIVKSVGAQAELTADGLRARSASDEIPGRVTLRLV